MSFRTWNVLVIGIALVCCAARPAGAQEQTGGIEGVIRDQQGALLPGVT